MIKDLIDPELMCRLSALLNIVAQCPNWYTNVPYSITTCIDQSYLPFIGNGPLALPELILLMLSDWRMLTNLQSANLFVKVEK